MANHSPPSCPSSSPSSPSPAPSIAGPPAPSPKPNSRKLNRARHRTIRLSREKQIPALAAHCAQFPRLRGKLQSLFEHEGVALGIMGQALFSPSDPPPSSSPSLAASAHSPCASAVHDGNGGNIVEVCFSDCSGGDGDVSELGSDRVFELGNWREESSSPLSVFEAPINVTRAASECSSDGSAGEADTLLILNTRSMREDDWGAEDWKLQAEVLMAECNLLRVEKELALRRWRRGCSVAAMRPRTAACFPEDGYEGSREADIACLGSPLDPSLDGPSEDDQKTMAYSNLYSDGSFAREALRRLQGFPDARFYGSMRQDPTEALQERLQKLLLAARGSSTHVQDPSTRCIAQHKLCDTWDANSTKMQTRLVSSGCVMQSMPNDISDEKRCLFETAVLRNQLDILSSELSETKAAAEFIRKEYRSMLSEETGLFPDDGSLDQALAEEMYCRVAIRKIAAQVQAEAEQWSQMQDILHNLQEEMETMNRARDIWEERALCAESQLLSLRETVYGLRCRAERAEEEASFLQSERCILKNQIRKMKHRHATERSRWLDYERSEHRERVLTIPRVPLNSEQSKCIVCNEEEKPRHASVGTQEDYALCESIVHSRNESSRSSFDMGSTTAPPQKRASNKCTKKSLDFSANGSDGSIKARPKNHRLGEQLLKVEAAKLDFCSRSNDVKSSVGQRTHQKLEPTKLESIEPIIGNEYMERKKARHFSDFKENGPNGGGIGGGGTVSIGGGGTVSAGRQVKDGIVQLGKKTMNTKEEYNGSMSSLTPSRPPFGDILNAFIPKQGHPLSSIVH